MACILNVCIVNFRNKVHFYCLYCFIFVTKGSLNVCIFYFSYQSALLMFLLFIFVPKCFFNVCIVSLSFVVVCHVCLCLKIFLVFWKWTHVRVLCFLLNTWVFCVDWIWRWQIVFRNCAYPFIGFGKLWTEGFLTITCFLIISFGEILIINNKNSNCLHKLTYSYQTNKYYIQKSFIIG